MLFFVNHSGKDRGVDYSNETNTGTGRDFFMNLLDNYGVDPATGTPLPNGDVKKFSDGTKTTDYIGINNIKVDGLDTLNLYVNGDNRSWSSGDYAVGEYQFDTYWLYNTQLQTEYKKENWKDGYYMLYTPTVGRYRNQMIHNEGDDLFMVGDWGGYGKQLRKMSQITKPNRTSHDSEEDANTTTRDVTYYLSMNILNGDSVTKELRRPGEVVTDLNKTMYINRYEIDKMPSNYELPLDIKITTSHKIKSITIKKKNDGTKTKTFVNSGNTPVLTGNLGELILEEDVDSYEDGNPIHVTDADKDYYMYILKIDQNVEGRTRKGIGIPKNWFKSGANNTIVVEAENELGGKMMDTITFVTRDFFMLN